MTQCWDEVAQLTGNPQYADQRYNADENRWESARAIIGDRRVTLGPTASQQWLDAPEHLAMVLARYRAAAALIGNAASVLEIGCGEGIGAGLLVEGRAFYRGIDTDAAAIAVASENPSRRFAVADALVRAPNDARLFGAVVSLDVIEHIPAEQEQALMSAIEWALGDAGVCVIGTPNAAFDHLASPQSRAGHVNTYTHARLAALITRHFRVVQMLGMQDTAIHFGHPDARHYHLAVGIGPRRAC